MIHLLLQSRPRHRSRRRRRRRQQQQLFEIVWSNCRLSDSIRLFPLLVVVILHVVLILSGYERNCVHSFTVRAPSSIISKNPSHRGIERISSISIAARTARPTINAMTSIQQEQHQQKQQQQQKQQESITNDKDVVVVEKLYLEPSLSDEFLPSTYSMGPIHSVAIVGGTHGNEYTGVWVVREWQSQEASDTSNQIKMKYPSMNITSLIGNPVAHNHNRRFMEVDLNRQFSVLELDNNKVNDTANIPMDVGIPLETKRAREINELLGPKTLRPDDPERTSNMDLIIDLHSTTAAMGTTLIIPEGDVLMIQAAAYVMYKCNEMYSKDSNTNTASKEDSTNTKKQHNILDSVDVSFETRIVIDHVRACHSTRPFLPSIGKHEFTIEVGPVPQGLLRHDAIIKTKAALYAMLEFIELYNNNNNISNSSNNQSDGDIILSTLQTMYPHGSVPCYTDLGKIPWPSHPDNPNFPLWVVHESIQDRDFQKIRKGDPIFVTLEGETIHYDGSLGEAVHLAFINEGGYYYSSSGTGVSVLQSANVNISTGIINDYVGP